MVARAPRKKRRPSRTRRGLTPGPAGPPLPPVEPAWKLGLELAFWIVFTAAAVIALLVLAVLTTRHEIALDLHHRNAVARVVDVSTGGKGPGTARIRFPAGDADAEATVLQPWFGRDSEVGDRLRIEYLPSNPEVARRAGAHDLVGLVAPLGVLALLVFIPELTRWQLRKRRHRS